MAVVKNGLMVLIFWLLAGVCPAEYAVFTRAAQESGSQLLSFVVGSVVQRIEVHFFKESEEGLCIVDEGNEAPRYGNLAAAMEAEKCTAGVNGGYFGADAARTPIGLVRHKGFTIAPFSKRGFTVSGIVYDTGRGICLERSTRLQTPLHSMQEAIQGGPFLVENGRAVSGLERTKKAARTFIATNGAGRWCIGITSPLTLAECAAWLAQPGCLGEFRVQAALNLDGGSSSSFWDKAAGVSRPGFKAVRNYVGVRPRRLSAPSGASAGKTPPAP